MKQTINFSQFCDAFRDMGRKENFSYPGLQALFDHLEELDEIDKTETELDVIALCCEFTEYADLAEFQGDYSGDFETVDDISEETIVIDVADGDGFIIQQF